ncbi:MAG: dephospho-CoA kinase [Pseudomonadota bacterium]|jgi:dephospho-CoA kinase
MIKVAITGGVASGKSEALNHLKKLGYKTMSSDEIVHHIMETNQDVIKKINALFYKTQEHTNEIHKIDRKAIGNIVFQNKEAMKKLEEICHPYVKEERKKLFSKWELEGEKIAFCETPLLFEKNLMTEFDKSILITCPLEERLERFINRTKSGTQKRFFEIAKYQMLDSQKTKLANYVINNSSKIENMLTEIEEIINGIIDNKQ